MKVHTFNIKGLLLGLLICLLAVSTGARFHQIENVPVGFYGKVIDQDGKPVITAKVSFDFVISHFSEYRTETMPKSLHTDQDGKFNLTGVTGYAIDKISIEKEGYELSQKSSRSYKFGMRPDYKPNPDNPIVFKMWKIAGKEPLIGSSWHGKVACDGTTNRFELSRGVKDTNGNLEIACLKTPLTVPPPGNAHFDYKFEIEVLGGAIQPTTDEFTYRAPENGYTPKFTISQKTNDPNWRGGVKQEFYLKTVNGQYGRLYVEWYASQTPPVHLEWNCSINPSGSRNLER